MAKRKFIWKSADTGKMVSAEYAKANPEECYKHNIQKDETNKVKESKLPPPVGSSEEETE